MARATIVKTMTKAEARAATDAIKTATARLWELLLAAYEGEAWRALDYESWRAWAVAEFDYSQSYAYRMLDGARVIAALSEAAGGVSPVGEIPERMAREIKPHLTEIVAQVRADVAAGVEPAEAVNNAIELAYVAGHRDAGAEVTTAAKFTGYSSESAEWYSPQIVIDAAVAVLGRINVDPCAEPGQPKNIPAEHHYTAKDDGLGRPWRGTVYMNPVYGDTIGDWIAKLITEHEAGRVTQAIALTPARTDTRWFQRLAGYPVCFVSGRLQFRVPKGRKLAGQSAPFPSAIFGLGVERETFLRVFGEIGIVYYERVTK
ncbi:MAG: hypothetical protein EPO22_06105 [Dehalococcoidia bacterium]|nr:MAG: hypothetical protein EPO22_06105 [Dehalococcoidia bacterium]